MHLAYKIFKIKKYRLLLIVLQTNKKRIVKFGARTDEQRVVKKAHCKEQG